MGRAGFAKCSITPPLGVELAGYGVYLQRRATEVHDDLFARGLALEGDDGERVLLLSLDLIGLSGSLSRAIADRAADAAGLDPQRVLVSCTHTHSGPAAVPMEGWGEGEPTYLDSLPGQCAEVATQAVAALHPVRVGTAHGEVRALGFNRVRADGPIDRGLHVLLIESMSGTPEIVLFSHGCHPVTIDRRTQAGTTISADWPGLVAERLSDEGYGEAIFRLGVCGDVDPVVAWHDFGFEGAALSAELVTQSLLALLRTMVTTPALTLGLARNEIVLSLEPLDGEGITAVLADVQTEYGAVRVMDEDPAETTWPRFFDAWARVMRGQLATLPQQICVPMAALRVNGDVWLHLPGEVFTSLGQAIATRSPFPHTVVSTLFGPFVGYLPDREDFMVGGYAATLVPRILHLPPFSPAVGDELVDGALALLAGLEK